MCLLKNSNSQNLINNYSFENYSSCPFNYGSIGLAQGWGQPFGSTSEYFNSCAQRSDGVSVPLNNIGYQNAKTGNGYVGIYIYGYINNDTNTIGSEYIQTTLTNTLQANSCYYFEMYYSVANASGIGTNRLQAYFSSTPLNPTLGQSFNQLQAQAEVDSTTYITDTLNWKKLSGSFFAVGGEKYLIIGNFKDKAHTKRTKIRGTYVSPWVFPDSNFCYVYIDDVILYECTDIGVQQLNNDHSISLFPNPSNGTMELSYHINNEDAVLTITDIYGQIISKYNLPPTQSKLKVDEQGLSDGVYFYSIRQKGVLLKQDKLIIHK